MSRFCVYRYFDEAGALLYVGSTRNLRHRTGDHRRQAAVWWDLAACITIERFPTEAEMFAAEERAIANERPRYNVALTAGPQAHKAGRPPAIDTAVVLEPGWATSRRLSPQMRRTIAGDLRARYPQAREIDVAKTMGISVTRLRLIEREGIAHLPRSAEVEVGI